MNLQDRYTDGTYANDVTDWHEGDAEWKACHIAKIIEKNKLELRTICDVGCGTGGVLHELQKLLPTKAQYTGFDISPQSISRAKDKENENLSFRQGNILEDSDRTFDLITLMDVFEHIPDYLGFLQNIREKSKYHAFHIPLDISSLSAVRGHPILTRRTTVGHLHHFTADTALATLQETGYTVIDWFYTASGFQPPDSSLKATVRDFPKKTLFKIRPDWTVRFMGGYTLMVLCK